MTESKTPFNVQQAIIGILATKFLSQAEKHEFILTQEDMKETLSKYSVRLELVHPMKPESSAVKCSLVTVEDALKMMKALKGKGV